MAYRNDIFVSVLMPNYNAASYVGAAIESILAQTHTAFELVIVDDCSTDASWDIIQTYAHKDSRIRAFRNVHNMNIPKTRNRLFREMSSESTYIAILDSDDSADPQRLKKQIDFLERNTTYELCGSYLGVIDHTGTRIATREYPISPEDCLKHILHFNPIAQSAVMMRATTVQKVGLYDEQSIRAQDYDYWIRVAQVGAIGNIPEVLTMFRMHDGQGKYQASQLSFWHSFLIRKRYLFSKKFFSFKGLLLLCVYWIGAVMPARIMVLLYRYVFTKK